jgi:hypothetical protein
MGRSTREIFDFLVRFGPFGAEIRMDLLRQRQTEAAATARDDPPAIRADSAGGPGEPGRPATVAGSPIGPGGGDAGRADGDIPILPRPSQLHDRLASKRRRPGERTTGTIAAPTPRRFDVPVHKSQLTSVQIGLEP